MNKKLTPEVAIGVILLVILFIGGIFWFKISREDKQTELVSTPINTSSETPKQTINNQQISSQIEPIINKETGWQKFVYENKGVSISIPKGWINESEDSENPLFKDENSDWQINVSFNTDKEDENWGIPYVERLLSTAKNKSALKEQTINYNEATFFIKEDLILDKNTIYKIYHPGYLKGLGGCSYYLKLKEDAGYVEFIVSVGANEAVVNDILKRVEIY